MTPSRALQIDSDGSAVFAVHSPPAAVRAGPVPPPVLICAPWGWDEVASYRARRDWALRLAARGHSTLRFDLPATGNSAGAPGDPRLLELWLGAIDATAAWLADDSDFGAVVALGLGLGGLLALAAARRGAPIGAVALWGTPASGRRFLRETRAFAAMQPWSAAEEDDSVDGVPPGWIEAGGFTLAPGTIDELGGFAIGPDPGAAPAQVLAFERDGIAPDRKLLDNLAAAGAAVERAAGPGWSEFVSHPERSRLPEAVSGTLERWLDGTVAMAESRAAEPRPASAPPASLGDASPGESLLQFVTDRGATVGVLAKPTEDRLPKLCAVFLDAGAVRSTGPSRLWSETARRWATAGVRSLRVDLEGIGEADGPAAGTLKVGDFYRPHFAAQLGEILDDLQGRGIADRFVLVGLCSGGFWAFRTAVADPRVVAVFEVNGGALRWDDHLLVQRRARTRRRVLEREYWRRLVRGEVGADKVLTMMRSVAAGGLPRARGAGAAVLARGIEADLDALAAADTHVLLAFSGGESLAAEIAAYGLADRGERWPNLRFGTLPGEDHTLRSAAAQRAARELLDGELERVLATVATGA